MDAIIEFKALQKEHMLQIVELMLAELQTTLKDEGIQLEVSQEAKEKLAEIGYHPSFGARPLRRAIQEHIEDQVADLLLDQDEVKKIQITVENERIVARSIN